jgi:hypothetical protein
MDDGGITLDRLLREEGPLPPAEALLLARQLAAALADTHGRGVVHGALTPASVLVVRRGTPRAVLGPREAVSSSHMLAYMAPERALDDGEATVQADVFGLGLVLFEMLEGRAFFASRSDSEILGMLRDDSTPLLPQFSRIPPAGASAVIAKAVRRAPAARFQSMEQMGREIEACQQRLGQNGTFVVPRQAPAEATPMPAETPVRKRIRLDEVSEALDDLDDIPSPAMARRPLVTRAAKTARRPRRVRPLALGALGVAATLGVVLGVPRPAWEEMRNAAVATWNAAVVVLEELTAIELPTAPAVPEPVPSGERWAGRSYRWFVGADEANAGFTLPLIAGAAASTADTRLSGQPDSPPAADGLQISDADVHAWLGRVESAWEAKNMTALRGYGVVATDVEAHALAPWLAKQDGYRVSIDVDSIQTHGRFAELVFYRADFDGEGRMLLTARESYTLEKRADGSVTVRGR